MTTGEQLDKAREDARRALSHWEWQLTEAVHQTQHAGRDHALTSLAQVKSAKRVLWMED